MRVASTLLVSIAASANTRIRLFSFAAAAAAAAATVANTSQTSSAFVLSASGTIHNLVGETSTRLHSSSSSSSSSAETMLVDPEYPGTAVERMLAVRSRVANLTREELNGNWDDVRRKLLWAGGLRDLPDAIPGQGYTGHSFNDWNHVDLTCMVDRVAHNENDGSVQRIAVGNQLGPGIRIASLPELGPGGSWSTCAIGCNKDPPQDVAHIQFRSRIAFKLVWAPTENFGTFVLVDDDGKELARGSPSGRLPNFRERQRNYQIVMGSKYGKAAEEIAKMTATKD